MTHIFVSIVFWVEGEIEKVENSSSSERSGRQVRQQLRLTAMKSLGIVPNDM